MVGVDTVLARSRTTPPVTVPYLARGTTLFSRNPPGGAGRRPGGTPSFARMAETWWPTVLADIDSFAEISALVCSAQIRSRISRSRRVNPNGCARVAVRGPTGIERAPSDRRRWRMIRAAGRAPRLVRMPRAAFAGIASEMGELFVSRFHPGQIDQLLHAHGFGEIADFGPEEARATYFPGRAGVEIAGAQRLIAATVIPAGATDIHNIRRSA
jgi:hypothetical protein